MSMSVNQDTDYYETCLGKEGNDYRQNEISWQEAIQPENVKKAFEQVKGTLAADVLVRLVFEIEQLTREHQRSHANHIALRDAVINESKSKKPM